MGVGRARNLAGDSSCSSEGVKTQDSSNVIVYSSLSSSISESELSSRRSGIVVMNVAGSERRVPDGIVPIFTGVLGGKRLSKYSGER